MSRIRHHFATLRGTVCVNICVYMFVRGSTALQVATTNPFTSAHASHMHRRATKYLSV